MLGQKGRFQRSIGQKSKLSKSLGIKNPLNILQSSGVIVNGVTDIAHNQSNIQNGHYVPTGLVKSHFPLTKSSGLEKR